MTKLFNLGHITPVATDTTVSLFNAVRPVYSSVNDRNALWYALRPIPGTPMVVAELRFADDNSTVPDNLLTFYK